MNNGIYNSHFCDASYFKKQFGQRIAAARKAKKLSRAALVDEARKLDPTFPDDAALKQWEYGTNAVPVYRIPLLCELLSCDAGYLFGEYSCRTREATDIQQATELSEEAVGKLLALEDDPACALENLITSPHFIDLLQALYRCLVVDFFPTDLERLLFIEDANADIPHAICFAHPDRMEEVNTARQFRRDICVFNTQRLLTEIATDFVNSSLDAFEEDQAAIAKTIASIKAKKRR